MSLTQVTKVTYTETIDGMGIKAVTVSSTLLDNLQPTGEVESADGAIGIQNGKIEITKTSAAALTLAAPTATTDDYKALKIIDTSGYLHTVTTPANKINGESSIVTFSGVVGAFIVLEAYQGVWYTREMANISSIV